MKTCSNCGDSNDDDDRFCGKCAALLSPIAIDQTQPQEQPGEPESPPQSKYYAQTQYKRRFSRIVPGLVVAVLAIVLLVVGIVLIGGSKKIDVPSSVDVDAALATAKTDFDSNNVLSASAPQQAVANGWYTNDLLIVTAQAVNASNNTARAIAASQQKVLDSTKTLSIILVISVGGLLLAFGAFFVLKEVLD